MIRLIMANSAATGDGHSPDFQRLFAFPGHGCDVGHAGSGAMMTASLAVSSLASGEPPINFAAHQIRAGNIAGAREDFQQMLGMLVAAVQPGARMIAANPGDWGID